jgi:hypothetical protein
MVVFVDVDKGRLDPYRGIMDPKGELWAYLKATLALPPRDTRRAFRYFFRHLDHPHPEVAADALREMLQFTPAELRELAPALPADRIAGWLQTPRLTPKHDDLTPERINLFAVLLGHCGTRRHADLLGKLLARPPEHLAGAGGLWVGYVMLRPRQGWEKLCGALADGSRSFMARYVALRGLRSLREARAEAAGRKEVGEALCLLLDQPDIADLAVMDLLRWGYWGQADRVLGLQKKPAYEIPIVRRSVLYFALSCKGNAAAARYVEGQRKKDPRAVSDAEELLKLEQKSAQAASMSFE